MKKILGIIPFFFLFCLTFACRDNTAAAELEKYKAQALAEEQNAELARSMFEGLNIRNGRVYQELFAPEYGWHFPANNPQAMTREEEEGFVKMLWAAFPDIRWDIKEISARGDLVVTRFTVRGTHQGEYQGLPPTGITCESGGLWTARVKDGRLVEAREEMDLLGWMQQLGLELKPKKTLKM